jgi:hypothetical protein
MVSQILIGNTPGGRVHSGYRCHGKKKQEKKAEEFN